MQPAANTSISMSGISHSYLEDTNSMVSTPPEWTHRWLLQCSIDVMPYEPCTTPLSLIALLQKALVLGNVVRHAVDVSVACICWPCWHHVGAALVSFEVLVSGVPTLRPEQPSAVYDIALAYTAGLSKP